MNQNILLLILLHAFKDKTDPTAIPDLKTLSLSLEMFSVIVSIDLMFSLFLFPDHIKNCFAMVVIHFT